jgi:hypothetical protein
MLCGQHERHYILQLPQLQRWRRPVSGFRFLSSFRALAPWCPVPGVPLRSISANLRERARISPLKGDNILAQGFNQVSTLGIRHPRMRPERGARTK